MPPSRPPSRPLVSLPDVEASNDPLWLCRLADIPDGGTRGLRPHGNDHRLIAVRSGRAVHVYINCCPHQYRPLEYRRDQFLAPDGKSLMCYAHGSRFCIDSGHCFVGPAKGRALTAVPIRVDDDAIWLIEPLSDDGLIGGG